MVEVTDLQKHYGAVRAVDGITFSVAEGEVFGLLGHNGAGKTTTYAILIVWIVIAYGALAWRLSRRES
jgi:ABC-2 type transport system ATP-binding protein